MAAVREERKVRSRLEVGGIPSRAGRRKASY